MRSSTQRFSTLPMDKVIQQFGHKHKKKSRRKRRRQFAKSQRAFYKNCKRKESLTSMESEYNYAHRFAKTKTKREKLQQKYENALKSVFFVKFKMN